MEKKTMPQKDSTKSYKGTMFFLGVLLLVIVATYLILMFVFNARF